MLPIDLEACRNQICGLVYQIVEWDSEDRNNPPCQSYINQSEVALPCLLMWHDVQCDRITHFCWVDADGNIVTSGVGETSRPRVIHFNPATQAEAERLCERETENDPCQVTWLVPADSVTDECPDGIASHVCVEGELICLNQEMVDNPTYVPVMVDGCPAFCPMAHLWPLEVNLPNGNTVTVSSGNDLRDEWIAATGIAGITWAASTVTQRPPCTLCFPAGTNPDLVPDTIQLFNPGQTADWQCIPLALNGGAFPCGTPWPVGGYTYNGQQYTSGDDLAAAIQLANPWMLAVRYRNNFQGVGNTGCNICVPPGVDLKNAPPLINVFA